MAGKLSSRKVETLSRPGRYSDGGNLYLRITPDGGKRWVFFYRFGKSDAGKPIRRDLGLGGASPGEVTLAEARTKALEARRYLNNGVDPITVMGLKARRKNEREYPMFGTFADEYVTAHRSKFRNSKHAAQWATTLGDGYCRSLRAKPINEIGTEDILQLLKPLWTRIPETASRLRGRIESVLHAAKARGFRDGPNPATWRGHLDSLLPARQRLTRGHHAALPYDDLPAFMAALRACKGLSALALEFTILTAARTSEVLHARWDEIDMKRGIWTIPAERMKAGREHRVPLVARVLEILQSLPRLNDNYHVFPGGKRDKPLSSMALLMLLRRMKREDLTTHGFRSTFRDWASETTGFPHEVCEMALAHAIGSRVEAAYRRGDLFDKRWELMEAWAAFCEPATTASAVSNT